jgi:WD40 repeat protein
MQYGAAWSENGGGDLNLWDVKTGRLIRRFDNNEDMAGIAFTKDGNRVITTSVLHNRAILWDVATGQPIQHYEDEPGIFAVAFVPESLKLPGTNDAAGRETHALFGMGDRTLTLRNIETGEHIWSFTGHESMVYGLDFSPDGRYVISGDESGDVILWDFETGEELRRFTEHTDGIEQVAFSPDGKTAFSSSHDGTAIQWRISDWPLDELLTWIKKNRYVRDFTCEEREQYRIEPLCAEGGTP